VLTTFVETVVTTFAISVLETMIGNGVMVSNFVITSVTVAMSKSVLVEVIEVVATRVAFAAQAHCWRWVTGGNTGRSGDRFLI